MLIDNRAAKQSIEAVAAQVREQSAKIKKVNAQIASNRPAPQVAENKWVQEQRDICSAAMSIDPPELRLNSAR